MHLEGIGLDSQLRSMLKHVWQTGHLSDMTLVTKDKAFKVHKFLISAHAAFFNVDQLSKSSVHVDLKSDLTEQVLAYLYEGQADVALEDIPSLKSAAQALGVTTLEKECRFALLVDVEITADNCLDVWEAARDVHSETKMSEALQVALECFQEIQHGEGFLNLPLDCILQYLPHADLAVQSPEERLAACITWVAKGTKERANYLVKLLELLPLNDMQDWYISQVLHHPIVSRNAIATQYLKKESHKIKIVTDNDEKPESLLHQPLPCQGLGAESILEEDKHKCYLVAAIDDNDFTNIYAFNLSGDMSVFKIGCLPCSQENKLTTDVLVNGTDFFVGKERYLLQFSLLDRTNKSLSRNTQISLGRYALHFEDGLYLVGSSLAMFNPYKDIYTCQRESGTPHYPLGAAGDRHFVSCFAPDPNILVICSDQSIDYRKTLHWHMVRLFSLTEKEATHSLKVPRMTTGRVYKVLPVDKSNVLLVTEDYTALLDVDSMKEGKDGWCTFLDNYIIPNTGCAVTFSSSSKDHILLLGGKPKLFKPQHYVYRARVQELIYNTCSGWQMVNSKWHVDNVMFSAYDTINVPEGFFG